MATPADRNYSNQGREKLYEQKLNEASAILAAMQCALVILVKRAGGQVEITKEEITKVSPEQMTMTTSPDGGSVRLEVQEKDDNS